MRVGLHTSLQRPATGPLPSPQTVSRETGSDRLLPGIGGGESGADVRRLCAMPRREGRRGAIEGGADSERRASPRGLFAPGRTSPVVRGPASLIVLLPI